MWFEHLTGFSETDPDGVRAQLQLDGEQLTSRANGRTIGVGRLTTPSLDSLRNTVADTGPGSINEIVANVVDLHKDPANHGAIFQVASQFNLLEMPGPSVTPLDGVDGYELDRTQGPACAIACGGATIYRNYFAVVDPQDPSELGQTEQRQIDCLADLGGVLGNGDGSLWTMRNGYCMPSPAGLRSVSAAVGAMSDEERTYFAGLLRVGVHANVEVTLGPAGQPNTVTQIFGSALPVAYAQYTTGAWAPFARLVLDASYEATLRTAHAAVADGASNRVFLTLLGGGAFGNEAEWIEDAIVNAVTKVGAGLDISIVSYGGPARSAKRIIDRLAA